MTSDETKHFKIYLKGEDKSASVRDFRILEDKIEVTFTNGKVFLYSNTNVHIVESALNSEETRHRFKFLYCIAQEVGLKAQIPDGQSFNILAHAYSKINFVNPKSVLATFLSGVLPRSQLKGASVPIYPFGFNASQKTAVDKALSNHLSVIEGPPGTGKTQTILNIISNIVMSGGSVAVVSGNNSAILNVLEKLRMYQVDFIAATLGNAENKKVFIESQRPQPNLLAWELPPESISILVGNLRVLQGELEEKLVQQNRLSTLSRNLAEIEMEEKYFRTHLQEEDSSFTLQTFHELKTSSNALEMGLLCETIVPAQPNFGFVKRLVEFFRNITKKRRLIRRLLTVYGPNRVTTFFQCRFYELKISELRHEISVLSKQLDSFDFESKMNEHSNISVKIFRSRLVQRYHHRERKRFELSELKSRSEEFIEEYPVVLSTTYSLSNSLAGDFMYDYVIVDESSQVDLCTGALALSCAKNAVVVGDLKQLPHVVDLQTAAVADKIFRKFNLPEFFNYKLESLLSSLKAMFPGVPATLLREHYRCHPMIIEFCNKKFYGGQLIALTKVKSNRSPLVVYKTVAGNHERNRINQRQIDVIKNEIIFEQGLNTADGSLGIVTPYRNQTNALQNAFQGLNVKADTVDRFQGQECPVIILSTVDNDISKFADNANRLNVAVSRAADQLIIIVNDTDSIVDTNIGDLVKYIEYNNFSVVVSKVKSVFDYLYRSYGEERRKFLLKHKRISEYDSENLMHALITDLLNEEEFKQLGVVCHVPLRMIIKDLSLVSPEEKKYILRPKTHVDFLIFDMLNKTPRLVVEVDGVGFHTKGSLQSERDAMKDQIFRKFGLPILRLRTDGSSEREQLRHRLVLH